MHSETQKSFSINSKPKGQTQFPLPSFVKLFIHDPQEGLPEQVVQPILQASQEFKLVYVFAGQLATHVVPYTKSRPN